MKYPIRTLVCLLALVTAAVIGCGDSDSPTAPGSGTGGSSSAGDLPNSSVKVANVQWDEVWSVGPGQNYLLDDVLLRQDGSNWRLQTVPHINSYDDMWGTGPDNIFVIGNSQAVYHFDGSIWSLQHSGGSTSNWLYAIHGNAPDNVFAAGDAGAILHYDGNSWTPMNSGVTTYITGLWVSPSGTAWAGVGDGTLLEYDGRSWAPTTAPPGSSIYRLYGTDDNDRIAFTDLGVFHWQGTSWTNIDSLLLTVKSAPFRCYAPGDGTYFFLDANRVVIYDGTNVAQLPTPSTHNSFNGITGTSPNHIVLMARDNQVFEYVNGTWTQLADGTDGFSFRFIDALSPDHIIAGGFADFYSALVYDGATWEVQRYSGGVGSNCISMVAPDTAIIGFQDGTVVRRYPGAYAGGGIATSVDAVWAQSTSSIYAFSNGTDKVHYFNGATWSTIGNPIDVFIRAAWGSSDSNIFVACTDKLYNYDGSSWSSATYAGTAFMDITGTGPTSIWAVGREGQLYHNNGSTWTAQLTLSNVNVRAIRVSAIWADSDTNVWVCGSWGLLAKYDGTAWTDYSVPGFDFDFSDLVGFDDGRFYLATGNGGMIIEYTPEP